MEQGEGLGDAVVDNVGREQASRIKLELAGNGGRRGKRKREGVVCDGGDPCPIYKLEALEAKQTRSGGRLNRARGA